MATDRPMQLGIIGLGRMGSNLVRRLVRDGHRCVVYDVSADAVKQLEGEGAIGSSSLEDFVSKLDKPRAMWIMVPAPIFETVAPGESSAEPTPGRTRTDGTAPHGYLHCGPSGAGHFVKWSTTASSTG